MTSKTFEEYITSLKMTNFYGENFTFEIHNESWYRCFENGNKYYMTVKQILNTIKYLNLHLYKEIKKIFPEEFI